MSCVCTWLNIHVCVRVCSIWPWCCRESSGEQLAAFVIRVHQMFASKGTFSPRLFHFLGIDFEKVQSEEVMNVTSALLYLSENWRIVFKCSVRILLYVPITNVSLIETSPLILSCSRMFLSYSPVLTSYLVTFCPPISSFRFSLLFLFLSFPLQEGAILAILDTPNRPYQTVWHLIDEKWLIRWRRYVRTYARTHVFDNIFLLEECLYV